MNRLTFNPVGLVAEEVYVSQAEANIQSGYPFVKQSAPHDTPLAVVGGGPSIRQHIAELVNWPGDVWAVNQGAQWLMRLEPKARVWMFSVDPDSCLCEWTAGVERALLGTSCHPKVFESLRGKDVRMFHTREMKGMEKAKSDERAFSFSGGPKAPLFGPSSVCRVFFPALMMGYHDITFFGCEGSLGDATHAYRDESEARVRQMIVRCGESEFVTTPDYYMTTQFLANVMHEYPKLKEKSGGLLRGMLQHWDTWEVVAYSGALRDQVCPEAVEPYIPRSAA